MGTLTPNFSFNLPTVGGDINLWGGLLNDTITDLDLLLSGTGVITPDLGAGWKVGGVAVTSTATELNILDGVTVTASELNVLDGIPGTLTSTELGYLDGVSSPIQTQIDGKLPSAGVGDVITRNMSSDPDFDNDGADIADRDAIKILVEAVGNGRVLLSDQSFVNVANVNFTQFNNSLYRWYEFEIEQALPVNNAVILGMRFSTNGGSSYDGAAGNYYMNGLYMEATTGPANDGGSHPEIRLSSSGRPISNVGLGARGQVKLRNAGNPAMYTDAEAVVGHEGSGGNFVTCWSRSKRIVAQDTDAVRFLMSAGNMTGRIIMYGHRL